MLLDDKDDGQTLPALAEGAASSPGESFRVICGPLASINYLRVRKVPLTFLPSPRRRRGGGSGGLEVETSVGVSDVSLEGTCGPLPGLGEQVATRIRITNWSPLEVCLSVCLS